MRRACCARYPHWIGIDKTLAHRWRFWPIETKSHRSYVCNAYRRSQPRLCRGSVKRESCILTLYRIFRGDIPHSIDEKDSFKKSRFHRCVSHVIRSLIVQLYGNYDVHPRIIADALPHIFSHNIFSPTFLLRIYLDSANLANIFDVILCNDKTFNHDECKLYLHSMRIHVYVEN